MVAHPDSRQAKANAALANGAPFASLPVPSVRPMPVRRTVPVLLLALGLAACSSSSSRTAPTPAPSAARTSGSPAQSAVPAEKNPPGDIPDNLAFVPYTNAAGHYSFTHPEGWVETERGSTVLFTDKLNGVQIQTGTATTPPTVASAQRDDVPLLQRTQAAFELKSVKAVTVPAGKGVLIVYRRNSAPDPVTGRQYRDEVQRYEIVGRGREVIVEMFGPVGADNVDAYRTMIQSLRIA
ncbi:MAG: PsbP [Frankiales bacterium]|nr:PsbP [Frankiales bacterium]